MQPYSFQHLEVGVLSFSSEDVPWYINPEETAHSLLNAEMSMADGNSNISQGIVVYCQLYLGARFTDG